MQHQQDLNANSSQAARVVASVAVAGSNPNNNGSTGAQSGMHELNLLQKSFNKLSFKIRQHLQHGIGMSCNFDIHSQKLKLFLKLPSDQMSCCTWEKFHFNNSLCQIA